MIIVIITITALMLLTFGVPAKILLSEIVTANAMPENTNRSTEPTIKMLTNTEPENAVPSKTAPSVRIRLVDHPNDTDRTMKFMLNASAAVHEAQQIQLQIYKELIGSYKKAILVGLAGHGNLGDHAISVGEFEALNKLGIELIYSCSSKECGEFKEAKKVVDNVTEPVVVLASGGGNFCIWKSECRLRERLIKAFPDREVLVFPQSVRFLNKAEMEKHASIMSIKT